MTMTITSCGSTATFTTSKRILTHCFLEGVYEVLSHVYLPYTMAALFNLYDLSCDPEIRQLAKNLIDIIVHQILLCCSDHRYNNTIPDSP